MVRQRPTGGADATVAWRALAQGHERRCADRRMDARWRKVTNAMHQRSHGRAPAQGHEPRCADANGRMDARGRKGTNGRCARVTRGDCARLRRRACESFGCRTPWSPGPVQASRSAPIRPGGRQMRSALTAARPANDANLRCAVSAEWVSLCRGNGCPNSAYGLYSYLLSTRRRIPTIPFG